MALWITISLAGYACIIIAFALILHWQKKDMSARIESAEKRIRLLEKKSTSLTVGVEVDGKMFAQALSRTDNTVNFHTDRRKVTKT